MRTDDPRDIVTVAVVSPARDSATQSSLYADNFEFLWDKYFDDETETVSSDKREQSMEADENFLATYPDGLPRLDCR